MRNAVSVFGWCLTLLFGLVCLQLPANAETRIALVIGNSSYSSTAQLDNPANDARLITSSLQKVGFQVFGHTDLQQKAMRRAVSAFARKITDAGPDTMALFFFAGHGLQVDGVNYLLPVDADVRAEADVPVEGISANDVFATLRAAGAKVNIIILDACRNNPFKAAARSMSRGLARMVAPAGSIISYATAPGRVAADGEGNNSPFSEALARVILTPNLTVEQVFKKVRISVHEKTEGAQLPTEESQLLREVYFAGSATAEADPGTTPDPAPEPTPDPSPTPAPGKNAQIAFYKALELNTMEGYEAFLTKFPNHKSAGQVREIIRSMSNEQMWLRIKKTNTIAAYRRYLIAFAEGHLCLGGQTGDREAATPSGGSADTPTGPATQRPADAASEHGNLRCAARQLPRHPGTVERCAEHPLRTEQQISNRRRDSAQWARCRHRTVQFQRQVVCRALPVLSRLGSAALSEESLQQPGAVQLEPLSGDRPYLSGHAQRAPRAKHEIPDHLAYSSQRNQCKGIRMPQSQRIPPQMVRGQLSGWPRMGLWALSRTYANGCAAALTALAVAAAPASAAELPKGFAYLRDVAPSIVQEMRYFGPHNFLGRRVTGYEAGECILTKRAALRLKKVQKRLQKKGLSLKVYDCYRPKRAVQEFVTWAKNLTDRKTKAEFYPTIPKSELFKRKYIAKRSRHSRGSTVDLAIVAVPPPDQPAYDPDAPQAACHLPKGQRFADNSLDFGTGYDCFHELSHTRNPAIKGAAKANRALLVAEMKRVGFRNYRREWWHFELQDEPYRKTYFDFPITAHSAAVLPVPRPRPSKEVTTGDTRLKVVCAGATNGVSVHDGPSIGHTVTAQLPADAWGLIVKVCDGEMPLDAWRSLDALGKKSVRPPWCKIEVPGPTAETPLVQGWVSGRFLTGIADTAEAECQ